MNRLFEAVDKAFEDYNFDDPIKDDVKRDLAIESGSDEEEVLNSLYDITNDEDDDDEFLEDYPEFLEYITTHPSNDMNYVMWHANFKEG